MYYMDGLPTYKLVVVGDTKTGKTSLIKRLLTGLFDENTDYWPTRKHTEQDIVFHTKRGPVRFNVWDTSAEQKSPGLRHVCHRGSDCAVIMCDVTNQETCDNVFLWNSELWDDCGRIPTVICGNKADNPSRTVFKLNPIICKSDMQYFDISVKNNYCCSEPFIYLFYQLIGERFHFVTSMPPNGLQTILEAEEEMEQDAHEEETLGKYKDYVKKEDELLKKIKDYFKEKTVALKTGNDHRVNIAPGKDNDGREETITNNQ
ncbi:GL14451 [Drosophila persimilis]|uniref:GL14451 n=1 Tax=Drosophila persimilis TaxID=7234 RepID=B4GTZ9_DROPE|nr:GL14451 [Drosophila persimilis]